MSPSTPPCPTSYSSVLEDQKAQWEEEKSALRKELRSFERDFEAQHGRYTHTSGGTQWVGGGRQVGEGQQVGGNQQVEGGQQVGDWESSALASDMQDAVWSGDICKLHGRLVTTQPAYIRTYAFVCTYYVHTSTHIHIHTCVYDTSHVHVHISLAVYDVCPYYAGCPPRQTGQAPLTASTPSTRE